MERDMSSIVFTAKDIFEQDFGREVRGYSKVEVDEFLDDVIKDYETYAALVKSLRLEIAELKEELLKKNQVAPTQSDSLELGSTTSMTNFDILKRLSNLEKHVFDSKLEEDNYSSPSQDVAEDDDDFYKTRVITPVRDNNY